MNPYGIEQVNVPSILNAYEGRQQNRLMQMMQQRQMERQDAQAEQEGIEQKLERHREQFVQGARLLEGVNDAESYQAARQAAVRAGMDVSEVPATYDPAYVEAVRRIGRVYSPQQPGQGFTLSPGQVRYGPDGQRIAEGPAPSPNYIPLPPGGRLVLEPGSGGPAATAPVPAPQPGQVEDGYRFRGGNPADPNSWEPVQGGPTPQASETFPQGQW